MADMKELKSRVSQQKSIKCIRIYWLIYLRCLHYFQAMAYSSFIYAQANVPDSVIPYVVVGQGAINTIFTLVSVGYWNSHYRNQKQKQC